MTTNMKLEQSVSDRAVNSDDALSKVIYDAIVDENLDWRQVDREEVKDLLVHAARARRNARPQLV